MAIDFAPSTVVRILQNIPLDNTYRSTIDFAASGNTDLLRLGAQQTYFMNKTKYVFTDFTYQRMERRIRVPANIEQLYDCNYVMYQNANFTNKWFYAFITNLEYANPETTWITIELDVCQTWLTEMGWARSFVLREHVADDTPGLHILPEDLDTGEYLTQSRFQQPITNWCIVVTTTSTENENVQGDVYNKIYSGCKMYAFLADDLGTAQLNSFLHSLDNAGKGAAVNSIFMFPSNFVSYDSETHEVYAEYDYVFSELNVSFTNSEIDGYAPKNKKLYTYPYYFLKATNNNGANAVYELEYFKNALADGLAKFRIYVTIANNPTMFLVPQEYKVKDLTYLVDNYAYMLNLSNFPQCQWSYGSYANWFAQNSAMINLSNQRIERNMNIDVAQGTVNTVIDGIAGIASLFTGGGIGGVQSAANEGVETYQAYKNSQDDIKANMLNVYQHSIIPNQAMGGTGGLGANVAIGIQNFFVEVMSIQAQFAKRIDDYFSFYGYKVNEFKVPELTSRPAWNYVQTIDANIVGSIPDEHITKLKSIFNKGVTIWHKGEYVNNYDLDNQPIGG